MCLTSREVEVKIINNTELSRNRDFLIDLLEDNLNINFPNLYRLREFSIKAYEDMICYSSDNSAIIIGAFQQELLIGFLWAYRREMLGEKRIHIGHIVVQSTSRFSGIGTKMLKYLENLSVNEGITKVELMTTISNEKTMKFYKANGYSTVRVQLEKELSDIIDNF